MIIITIVYNGMKRFKMLQIYHSKVNTYTEKIIVLSRYIIDISIILLY